jgi:RND family efflux transporter, MFP subunit
MNGKMKTIFYNRYVRYSLFALGGLFLGWLLFHNATKTDGKHPHTAQAPKATIWTCSMHPQIRMPKPGKCPICGMDLIPLVQGGAVEDPSAIHFTKEAAALANVQTTVVSRQQPVKELRLYGKLQADERLLQSQVAHIPGRIERLLVNFTGEPVRKGQILALIYSPELVTAQQELLETAKEKQHQPELYQAAKEKLHLWKLSDRQIAQIESTGRVKNNFEITANTSGIVTGKRVSNGDYVSQGMVLFDIANLSSLWVMFDAYESDLPFIKRGDKISYTIQALPGENFEGTIKFIDPVVDPTNRVSKVRVEIGNHSGKLKPEMFATGIIKSNLSEYKNKIVIPSSAVLWTGKRSIVYVKQPNSDEPIFKMREIELGPKLGDSFIVEKGLSDGEQIVTQGTFSVDAAAQLEGKPSMMNSEGGKAPAAHSHGDMPGMDMSSTGNQSTKQAATSAKGMATIQHATFKVFGNCESCKKRIENAARSVKGVARASWNMSTKKIHVEYDATKTNLDAIHRAIAKVGHDTDKLRANDKTYNALPSCCLYRK